MSAGDPDIVDIDGMDMKRIFAALVTVLLMAAYMPVYAQELPPGAETDGATFVPRYKNPTPGQMPILMGAATGMGDNRLMLTEEWYAWLEDLGVNMISGLMGDMQTQMPRIFELSEQHNLKMLMRLVGSKSTEAVMQVVRQWRDCRSLGGYMVYDEPVVPDFPELRKLRDAIFTMDTTRIVMVNLFPIVPAKVCKAASYQDYVERSIREINTGLLSYDHYPVVEKDGVVSVKKDFYENLEIISSQAGKAGWPFWAYSLVFGHYGYAPPVESDIRFEVFNALAYGAQGIEYWTYGVRPGLDFKPTIAPIDTAGRRTRVWYDVQRVNREIQGLNPVFLGCEVVSKGHVGTVPQGAEPLETMPGPLQSVKSGRQGVLVSQIRNQDRDYIVIVNHEPRQAQKVRLRFNGDVSQIYPDGRTETRRSGTFKLAPGGYLIFRY